MKARRSFLFFVVMACALPLRGQIPCPGPGSLGDLGARLVFDPSAELMAKSGASRGAYIDWVVTGSPADQAGVRSGDVIIQIVDVEINSAFQLNLSLH